MTRYLKLVFGFSMSFAPFSREQAFTITVASFAKTLQKHPHIVQDGEWMPVLFRGTLAECMRLAPLGGTDFRQGPLKTVQEALIRLSPGDKALLLFRDQCHFSFETIGSILGTGSQESRSACLAARERLRGALKEILAKPEAGHGV